MTPATIAHHLVSARQRLAMALHYHRFFGQPIAGLSPEHNSARRRVNDTTIATYAADAGRFAAYAGVPPLSPVWLQSEVARAALDVELIFAHFVSAYVDTLENLAEVSTWERVAS